MKTKPHPIGRRGALLAGLLTSLLAGFAHAQSSPYYVGAMVNISHADNLLQLVDGREAPAGYSKSDRITTTALLAGLDQHIGRQRVFGNLSLRSNRYADNSLYDNQSYTASLGLDWSTVEHISGTLVASANRNLASFSLQEIGLLEQKNLETVQTLDATLRVGLVTRYSLEAALGQMRVKNSLDAASVKARDYNRDTASLGLRWRPSAASSLGLAWRGTKGRYPHFQLTADGYQADRFDRQDVDLTATWQPSGASHLDLRLSSGKTEYDLATQRDYSGLTGTLGWRWQTSGKLRLETRLTRDTGQDSYAVTTIFGTPGTTDYSRIANTLGLRADYAATAKINVNLGLQTSDRKLVRTQPGFFGPIDDTGSERTTTLSLGVRWTPYRSLALGCEVGNNKRRGDGVLGTDMSATTYGCNAQLTLQ